MKSTTSNDVLKEKEAEIRIKEISIKYLLTELMFNTNKYYCPEIILMGFHILSPTYPDYNIV